LSRRDLRLDGYIQSGRRLVRNQEIRLVGQSHGDHDAVPLSAGELMRIGAEPLLGLG
jgi:hypothetical protein